MKNSLQAKLDELRTNVDVAIETIHFAEKSLKLEELNAQSTLPNFWDDSVAASAHMKLQTKLASELEPWQALTAGLKETAELIDLNDEALQKEIESQLQNLESTFEALKKKRRQSHDFRRITWRRSRAKKCAIAARRPVYVRQTARCAWSAQTGSFESV